MIQLGTDPNCTKCEKGDSPHLHIFKNDYIRKKYTHNGKV